jgi:predicted ATP-dependent serine protease
MNSQNNSMNGMTDDDLKYCLNDDFFINDIEAYKFKNYLEKAKMKPEMKMLFGRFFQTGEICILAGKTGVGKSILAYQIADGISRGISILDQENEAGAQKVLYYDFELSEGNINKRFPLYEPNENFYRPDVTDIILKNEGVFNFQIVADDIDLLDAKIVIIDNISAIALRSTQDQDTALKLMKDATMLKRQKNVSILLVAHTPKLKETRPLELYDIAGSANIHNFIDNAIMIGKSSQDLNIRYVKQVKFRNTSESDDVLLLRINNNDWLHYDFEGYDDESKHLALDQSKEEVKKSKLREIAETVFENSSLSYIEFCNNYAKLYGKTSDNGKKIIHQLIRDDIIIKGSDGRKYIINKNGVSNEE